MLHVFGHSGWFSLRLSHRLTCTRGKEDLVWVVLNTSRGGGGGGVRCLFRVQNNFFNERPSAGPWHRKKHQLSLVYFRDLFCQYEIVIWAFPHKETARSICLGRLLHCGQIDPRWSPCAFDNMQYLCTRHTHRNPPPPLACSTSSRDRRNMWCHLSTMPITTSHCLEIRGR